MKYTAFSEEYLEQAVAYIRRISLHLHATELFKYCMVKTYCWFIL